MNIPNIQFIHVNTAAKARSLDRRALWERIVGQGFSMFAKNKELKKSIRKEKEIKDMKVLQINSFFSVGGERTFLLED